MSGGDATVEGCCEWQWVVNEQDIRTWSREGGKDMVKEGGKEGGRPFT